MMALVEDRIKSDPVNLVTTKLYNLSDVVDFEKLHLEEPSLIYSRCLYDLTTLSVSLRGKNSIEG